MKTGILSILFALPSWCALPVITTPLTARPAAVRSGNASILSWAVTGATTVYLSDSANACWSKTPRGTTCPVVLASGTYSVNPKTPTTYVLMALNADGIVPSFVTVAAESNSLSLNPASTCTGTLDRFDLCEISLAYSRAVPNPWEDVKVQATFTAPSANIDGRTTFQVEGYYYGGTVSKLLLYSSSPGVGCQAGDILNLGGSPAADARIRVDKVSGNGSILAFTLLTGGTAGGYYAFGNIYPAGNTTTAHCGTGLGRPENQPEFYVTATTNDTWKVRFAPEVIGTYTWSLIFAAPNASYTTSGSFSVTAGTNTGFIRLWGSSAPYSFRTEGDGRPFFPIGIQQGLGYRTERISMFLPNHGTGVDNVPNTPAAQWLSIYQQAGMNLLRNHGQFGSRFGQGYSVRAFHVDGKNTYDGYFAGVSDNLHGLARKFGMKVMYQPIGNPLTAGDDGKGLPNFDVNDLSDMLALMKAWKYYIARYSASIDIWELVNENGTSAWPSVPKPFLTSLAAFVKAQDPYRHLITTSYPPSADGSAAKGYAVPNIDIINPHAYINSGANGSGSDPSLDLAMAIASYGVAPWRASIPNQPMIFGEGGNLCPTPDYDPIYHERYRIMIWTYALNDAYLVPWNSFNGNGRGCGSGISNMFVGSVNRQYSLVLSKWLQTMDPTAVPVRATVDIAAPAGHSGLAYCKASATYVACYLTHTTDHSTALRGSTLTINVPSDSMSAVWIDPSTGNLLGSAPVNRGSQQLVIPAWTTDVALAISMPGSAPPK